METPKSRGAQFLSEIRSIISECEKLQPERRARVVAFSIMVLIDGSGEHVGKQYKLFEVNENDDLLSVDFLHHEL